jgi:hypothetical protein
MSLVVWPTLRSSDRDWCDNSALSVAKSPLRMLVSLNLAKY